MDRGAKRARVEQCDDGQVGGLRPSIKVEVTTGEGVTVKLELASTATVLDVKEGVQHAHGISTRDARLFVHNESRGVLRDEETLTSLSPAEDAMIEMCVLVEQADAQQIVPGLSKDSAVPLRSTADSDVLLEDPIGVAFVPSKPNWLVITEIEGHRVKIVDIRTRNLICEIGEEGTGAGQFKGPWGIAISEDSSLVLIAENANHRVQVLRLKIADDGENAQLEFVRFIGKGLGSQDGELRDPAHLVFMPGVGGQDTVLVGEDHRVSQFALDGTFIRIFAGTGKESAASGELNSPDGMTVLHASREVAIADRDNHRIQIFDDKGVFKREFGKPEYDAGDEKFELVDGQFWHPSDITSDAHGNLLVVDYTSRLQVLTPEGKLLCTKEDLGLHPVAEKGVAWSADGGLAVSWSGNTELTDAVFMWGPAASEDGAAGLQLTAAGPPAGAEGGEDGVVQALPSGKQAQ
jgi:DNA-binding beta-propeller fold protein YncE